MLRRVSLGLVVLVLVSVTQLAVVDSSAVATPAPVVFSTGTPDGLMAMASRPASAGKIEIEAADDFVLAAPTQLTSATFTGLVPSGTSVQSVDVEIYQVFPVSSTTPPSGSVPTRTNSPADVVDVTRGTTTTDLTFSTTVLNANFTAANSVQAGGIHPLPNVTTGGDGAVSGQEVRLDIAFTTPINLPAGQFFFVPQVELPTGKEFLWLSAPRPIAAPGTPFVGDLQTWTRDASLDPDWLRVGTDIVGGTTPPTFNGTFSLAGTVTCPTITVTPTSLPTASVGAAYDQQFAASGGTAPYGFATTGTLPDGLTLDATGRLSGAPTVAGSSAFTVTATDGIGCDGSASTTLAVTGPTTSGATAPTAGAVPVGVQPAFTG
jgi:hypothetical protein